MELKCIGTEYTIPGEGEIKVRNRFDFAPLKVAVVALHVDIF
jgi:hypothetical protein